MNNKINDTESLTEAKEHPLTRAENYIPTEEEVKALIGLTINEMHLKLDDLKGKKFREFHNEVNKEETPAQPEKVKRAPGELTTRDKLKKAFPELNI